MHFLLSLSALLSLPVLSPVCIPRDITKVTCSNYVSIQIRGATVVGLCPSPQAKAKFGSHFCISCCSPGGGSLAREERMDLEAWGTGCSGRAAGLPKQSPTLGSVHLLSKVLALSRAFHLLLDRAVTSLLVTQVNIC